MKTNSAYSALGSVFEELNKDCDYEKWSQYLIEKLKESKAGNRGIDMGCGNGYFTRALHRAGYTVTGMDLSPEMLSSAVNIARREGVTSEFLLGDITDFTLNFKADFLVAVNDCINYIAPEKLFETFKRVYKNIAKGGTFIFDISSEYKLKNIIGNNIFADDGDDITYIWFNSLIENRVEMDITVFSRRADGSYLRADEKQTQYIYGETHICNLLKDAGFAVKTEGHLGGDKQMRINFICKKL